MSKTILATSLLTLVVSGCAQRTEEHFRNTFDAATVAIRRGELDTARDLAERVLAQTRAEPESPWARRFSLLLAEVHLRKHDLVEARQLLLVPPPEGAAFGLVRARWRFLVGFRQLLEGDRRGAAATMDLAGRDTPATPEANDTRLDVGVYSGVAALQLGQYEQGQAYLTEVLRVASLKGDRFHQAAALVDLGYGQIVQKRYDAALVWLTRALTFTDLGDFSIYADALINAGLCYSRLGLFDQAMAAQRQAVERHKRGVRREYALALGELGSTYILRDDVRASLPYLRKALEVSTAAGVKDQAALWAGNLASAHIDLGDWDEAERFNDEGARLKEGSPANVLVYNTLNAARIAKGRGRFVEAERLFGQAVAGAGDNPSVRWSAHEGLASVAVAAGRPADATRHFEIALQTIERTRSDLIKTEYKLSYLTRLIDFYRAYVDWLVDQGQIERALEIADSSRGRVLAERQGIAATSPGVKPAALRAMAGESGTVFLSYWLAPARSYLWLVTPARVQMFTLPPAKEIDALIRDHQAAIDNALADPLKASNTAGDRLFELLVQPALPSIPRGSRVLIVPDAALYALNFETLPVTSDCRLPTPDCRHYLIENFEIAVAPSLAMLTTAQSRAPAPEKSILLIGDAAARAPDYPALKFASAEMANVARHFPAEHVTSYQGERAIPAAYRDARPDRFSYVHFTAHATANLDSPLDSAVILSGPDAAFKLYARDVAALPLRAELVTVSACRSAGERTYSGEGLIGFAWAFLRGGARRVVAGLWDVDDKSTAELMDGLYGGLAAGEAAGKALRDAKLSLLRRGGATARPYYWAPFELFTLTP